MPTEPTAPLQFTIDEVDVEQRPLPVLAANEPYVFGYARNAWAYYPDGKVRPDLAPIPLVPGLHGVGELSRGNRTKMLAKVRENLPHLKIISPNVVPLNGISVRDPQAPTDTTRVRWMAPWEVTIPSSSMVTIDYAKLDAAMAKWVAAGEIPTAPEPDVVVARVAVLVDEIDRAAAKLPPGGESRRLSELRRELDAWKALAPADGGAPTSAETFTVDEGAAVPDVDALPPAVKPARRR